MTEHLSNMDTELFMECEEEELEPWQQVDDSVEEDEVDYLDEELEDDSLSSNQPSETPSTTASSTTPAAPAPSPAQVVSVVPPRLPTASAPPLVSQATPLILTQTTGGTFFLPAAPGSGNTRPILLTTQGFPVQTVVKPVTPLVLNLQPGQRVQPLTLIQCRSGDASGPHLITGLTPSPVPSATPLGQLVRPGVGVSSVLARSVPATCGSPPKSSCSFMQLPPGMTFHTNTSTAANLQVGGTKPIHLTGSPAPPSGSTNGVNSVVQAPGPAPPVKTANVVMSVDEFYYGMSEGDLSLRKPHTHGEKTSYTCHICSYVSINNLSFMQHLLQHSQLVSAGRSESTTCCCFCFRQFSSPSQLFLHQDQVHGSTPSACMCRICEWAFESEPAFLNHMKSNHKPGEMPYICQVCSYRSSFYSDVLQHFASFHGNTRFLLCVFCLKVTKNQVNYVGHVFRHQVNQAFHCNRCRLQFVFLKEKMQHKAANHRSVRRLQKLHGLLPGSKVTIRIHGKPTFPLTPAAGWSRFLHSPTSIVHHVKNQKGQQQSPPPKSPNSPLKRAVSRHFMNPTQEGGKQVCLECGTDASDFAAHYPTHVRCLLCRYSSCCSRAYADHMIHHHVPRSKDKDLPLHKLPPPSPFLLRCTTCHFSPSSADHMADHLLKKPDHHSATCHPRDLTDADIQWAEEEEEEEEGGGQMEDPSDPSWRSADRWKEPSENVYVVPFSHPSGPDHFLSRSSDAIDFFNQLFPAALVELIAKETNAHVKTCRHLGGAVDSDWVAVTSQEVKAFIGLCVLMGIQNLPDPAHYWSWSHHDNSHTFLCAMSFSRFRQIAANIRMGSFSTAEVRGAADPADPLHIFRPMLELLGAAMWDTYRPNACLTIDRALLPSPEGGAAPGNPKTQPRVWLLCDSKSGYCHRFFIQVGAKAGRQDPGFTVVPELVKGLENKHHQLYLANSLMSVPLAQKLLDQGVYASSSFPPPSGILPRALWDHGELRRSGDFLQRQCGPLLATRWRDTKEMGCLSTNAAAGDVDTVWRRSQTTAGGLDPIRRPLAFRLLQENMRGVDICKQLLACNPLGGIQQDRHWRSLFWFLVNLSIVNAFIVLRESRKDNPPPWVQDGLFTQVKFRKRLGHQLAKCTQTSSESTEVAGLSGKKGEAAPADGLRQRHRLEKVSSISKRCRNCSVKNVRHESVYGCAACRASLCKRRSCFWEFHGLSHLNRGSARTGFLKNSVSGEVLLDAAQDGVDESMAPVEEFSDDEEDAESEDRPKDIKDEPQDAPLCPPDVQPPPPSVSKEREDFLSTRQPRIMLLALCDGVRQACRVFDVDVRLLHSWLKDARSRLQWAEPEEQLVGPGAERMVGWVLGMREQQLPIGESSLFHKASSLKKKGHFSESFPISYGWAVGFMLRQRLGVRSVGRHAPLASTLPPFLEDKVRSFRTFTQKLVRTQGLLADAVAAMDELCLFVDLRAVQDRQRRAEALEVTGSLPLVTVYLSALADGTVLPALVLVSRQLVQKVPPDLVVLEFSPGRLSAEEALDLWTKSVWLKRSSRRTLLVLDGHRAQVSDQLLGVLSGAGTLPAVVPAGCSSHLQPLDVCVKPVLQRYLLSRWAKFSAGEPEALEETCPQRLQANVTQLLVDWVVDALTHLRQVPQAWTQSFHLTGLLPGRAQEDGQKPEDVQLNLLKTLTDAMLGADAPREDWCELQDLEDEEDESAKGHRESERWEKTEEDESKAAETQKTELDEEDIKQEDKERDGDTGRTEDTQKKQEDDSEEEGRGTEDKKEEKRETRIVIGEEVGDEWKLTVKSRTDGVKGEGEDDS